ncbi:hypothetical protein OESDEN_15106 [Oesophagostomum dentatum]|uniref:Fatty-acid and retinol-binding protein 1 n=1 Tax=Oesophagostomum dentatum TaxID=61180 RepID=A0A0B1SNV5_OESDE|nr:hypothetical protein OESDEN_15106 [Oesophagostomum dentatum]
MRFVLLSVVLVAAAAAHAITDFTLTVEMLDKAINRVMKHKDRLPKLIREQIESATPEEKQEFVNFVNKVHKGEITKEVTNTDELVQLIKQEAPLVGKKVEILHNDYKARVGQLTQQAQEFLAKWEKIWFKTVQENKADRKAFFEKMAKLVPEFLAEVKGFTEETWKSFEQQFPEQMQFWKDTKEKMEEFKTMLGNLSVEDKEKIKNFAQQMKEMKPEDWPKTKEEAYEKFEKLGLDKLLPAVALKE